MSDPAAPRILVVEDEAVVAMDIQSQLRQLGYKVAGTCSSGEEALRLARQRDPDLVLLDIRLKGKMDGVECGTEIRGELGIPVIYLTAYADDETLRRAKATGPHGYILKPFDQRDLRVTLEVALHKHGLEQALEKSHKNLLGVLDAQRSGAVLLDEDGRVAFLSRPTRQMLHIGSEQAVGRHWREVLTLSEANEASLAAALELDPERREKLQVEIRSTSGSPSVLEIEIVDDPGVAGRTILFLYDVSELFDLRSMLDGRSRFENIVGESEAIRRVFRMIRDIAEVDSPVLIEGETGTGKELAAEAIHRRSRRCDGPFVAVNCGGLSDELAASQLFGHRRGAFTGAVENHAGLFEAANGGTLFLDEIAELSPRTQALFLRALDEGAVARVGESAPRRVDVRVIAATNKDLASEIEENNFRRDLYYRIRVARIRMPALRERRSDIPLLAHAFLGESRARRGKAVESLSDEALRLLLDYAWRGNVRELKNAIEFATIHAKGPVLQPQDLPPELSLASPATEDEAERIKAALRRAGGNRKEAAKLLGCSRATLYRRLEQYGLKEFRLT